ncbi:MAG TPA: hypothetical protein VG323_05575, partial [Thermoanaerobaculia bacterium]|nr:hypothetical protein [Thermoanaerobaculia bacterium]
MKRYVPFAACIAGIVVVLALLPRYNAAQPRGIRLTRGQAITCADAVARDLGIPVGKAWANVSWTSSPLLEKELRDDPQRRVRAYDDPTIAPRLGSYRRTYYRPGQDKYTPFGVVSVDGRSGEIVGARMFARNEETGKHTTETELRPRADAFVRSRAFPGAPSPQFESARPTVLRTRTDWVFRYRVPSSFAAGKIVPYLNVYYIGDRFAGWMLGEEYADGSSYVGDSGSSIVGVLL